MTKNILKAALYGAAFALIAWTAFSFFDIIINNLTTGTYWKYNLFIVMLNARA